ncbi:hypothetical protein M569_15239 [Genlisea aurea]|uniref:Non-structural maintenance of chromosomes element 1 homolog n=1 Tax=Genlisea aurea TaxID=192259 RepID=S8C553_9LAMI|nr:hypothetical protein M569_15239 [Genlisea aurea]
MYKEDSQFGGDVALDSRPRSRSPEEMPPLNWRHHTLIQTLLSKGPLKEDDFRSIFSQITRCNSGIQSQLFNDYLLKINEELSYVQFELRACRNQFNGDVYYGVVNNVSDDQSKLGTKYTLPQIALYKAIVEAITQDVEARGCISSTDALYVKLESKVPGTSDSQLPPGFKSFSMSQKEKTLEQLIKDDWLCSLPDGRIGIGIRSFLELRSWFRKNEVPTCDICNDAAVKAELCPNESCNARRHEYCLRMKAAQRKVERVCPGCGMPWPGPDRSAEAAEGLDDEDRKESVAASEPRLKRKAGDNDPSSTSSRTAEKRTIASSAAMDAYSWLRRNASKLNKAALPSSYAAAGRKISDGKPGEGEETKVYGITEGLIEFVKSFTVETFRNYSIPEEEEEDEGSGNLRMDLSEWQENHAKLVLAAVKELAQLRFRLSPGYLKERQFWRIYFSLVRSHVAKYEIGAARMAELEWIRLGNPNHYNSSSSSSAAAASVSSTRLEVEMLESKLKKEDDI